jgi:hypothetical protein
MPVSPKGDGTNSGSGGAGSDSFLQDENIVTNNRRGATDFIKNI